MQFALAVGGLTLAALLALCWRATGVAGWGVALVTLQALSVAAPALAYLPRPPARWLYPETPALAWLRAHAGPDRVVMPGHVGLLYGLNEAHGYENHTGTPMTRAEQLLDSIDTPGGPWTELWAPVGLRYHALHHEFPGIPYHNLPAAYRRLQGNDPYRRTTSPGLWASLRRLWQGRKEAA